MYLEPLFIDCLSHQSAKAQYWLLLLKRFQGVPYSSSLLVVLTKPEHRISTRKDFLFKTKQRKKTVPEEGPKNTSTKMKWKRGRAGMGEGGTLIIDKIHWFLKKRKRKRKSATSIRNKKWSVNPPRNHGNLYEWMKMKETDGSGNKGGRTDLEFGSDGHLQLEQRVCLAPRQERSRRLVAFPPNDPIISTPSAVPLRGGRMIGGGDCHDPLPPRPLTRPGGTPGFIQAWHQLQAQRLHLSRPLPFFVLFLSRGNFILHGLDSIWFDRSISPSSSSDRTPLPSWNDRLSVGFGPGSTRVVTSCRREWIRDFLRPLSLRFSSLYTRTW